MTRGARPVTHCHKRAARATAHAVRPSARYAYEPWVVQSAPSHTAEVEVEGGGGGVAVGAEAEAEEGEEAQRWGPSA